MVDYIYLALYEYSLEDCSVIENKCRSFRDDIFCDVVSQEAASFYLTKYWTDRAESR